ncbi:hypothetical protein TRAPUB_8951 [Trametes pubescens]|uniref:Uncharacterized protein n=1 Tax=Trametes pubescens TaxID=154538 RepID=A0A1M2W3R7_TRAPU|nr:hypothetical protein TRAPUB_8951 [Trametes pubescens]
MLTTSAVGPRKPGTDSQNATHPNGNAGTTLSDGPATSTSSTSALSISSSPRSTVAATHSPTTLPASKSDPESGPLPTSFSSTKFASSSTPPVTTELTSDALSASSVTPSSHGGSHSSTATAATIQPFSTVSSPTTASAVDASIDNAGGHSKDLIIALSSVLGLLAIVASVLGYFLWSRKRRQARSSGHEDSGSDSSNTTVLEEEGATKSSGPRTQASDVPPSDNSTIMNGYATTSLVCEPGSPRSSTSPPSFRSSPEVASSRKTPSSADAAPSRNEPRNKHASPSLPGEPASFPGSPLPRPWQGIRSGLGGDEVVPREPWASDDREEEPPPYEPRAQEC